MGKLRKKGESGTKKNYINRDKAIKKLQLSIKDFRRLCIIKGIYPVEPAKKSKITKSSKKKTYYLSTDIRYLSNEPLIWKFWEFKSYMKRIGKCKGRGDYDLLNKVSKTKPSLKFDQVLKERYPRFTDALRDIDDALCMCFLYANLTKNEQLPGQVIKYSRRLISEFMHYVIETRSLRKVFVSIKGIYFQVQIMGQEITFITPHKFSFIQQQDIDYSVMRTFTEFYITLLGFVNYKLLTSANFHYPPKVNVPEIVNKHVNYSSGSSREDKKEEHINCLNLPLIKSVNADVIREEENLDYFEDENEYHEYVKFTRLFEGFKFFLNCEVPRDVLVFTIRCFGGQVSWDPYLSFGSTYEEDDETITHQIVDRDNIDKKFLNRHYIQPQWVFDCVNNKRLLPIEDYFIGVELPPHLSPFVEEKEGDYVPAEKEALKVTGSLKIKNDDDNANEESDNIEEDSSDDDDDELPVADSDESDDDNELNNNELDMNDLNDESDNESIEQQRVVESDKSKMKVQSGKVHKVNLKSKKAEQDLEERKLSEMMIPRKNKRLYHKIKRFNQHKQKEVENLKSKRNQLNKNKISNKKVRT